jgi:hypothetical protein
MRTPGCWSASSSRPLHHHLRRVLREEAAGAEEAAVHQRRAVPLRRAVLLQPAVPLQPEAHQQPAPKVVVEAVAPHRQLPRPPHRLHRISS